jgi:hypothetical protein
MACEAGRICRRSGGGGNRTPVRSRTDRTSTSVVRASSHPPAGSRTTHRRASHPLVSRVRRLALPSRRARSLAPAPGPRAQPGSASPYLDSTRRRVRVRSCSHLLWCRLIYEANRRPRLAALPENRPRRNLVAPVCVIQGRRIAADTRIDPVADPETRAGNGENDGERTDLWHCSWKSVSRGSLT